MTWRRDLPPTPDDLLDNDGAPPSKADYRQVWLAYCRQQLDEANARRLEARNARHLDNREEIRDARPSQDPLPPP